MIRRLRIKLLAISMLSLLLVLLLIMGGVNVVNYRHVIEEADSTLDILAQNGGRFPKKTDRWDDGQKRQDVAWESAVDGSAAEESVLEDSAAEDSDRVGFDEGGRRNQGFSKELPYEARYYSVLLEDSGQVVSVDTGKIAAVDTETAMEYAQQAYASGRTKGFISDYRYVCHSEDNGQKAHHFFGLWQKSADISILFGDQYWYFNGGTAGGADADGVIFQAHSAASIGEL